MIEEFVKQNKQYCEQKIIGESEKGKSINALSLRKGKGQRKKAMLLSCLHGNEKETIATNLKVLENILHHELLNYWELVSIPKPNPDGTELGIRCNADNIDLNRDFILKKSRETKTIINLYESFKPEIVLDYHSNLSNKFSCIIIPETIDMGLCRDIIFSYQEIREQTNLAICQGIIDSQNNTVACFHTKGVYILIHGKGLFVEYASQKSKIATVIEDYGTELSTEFSTELLRRYQR